MENEISNSRDWIGMLFNLGFFLGLVAVVIFPAMKFQNMAKRKGERGWLFFIVGLGVGLVSLVVSKLFMAWLISLMPPGYQSYLFSCLFFVPPIIIFLVFNMILKKNL